eukprot:1177418-Prorocentrum_minimum.AAC.2
MRPCQALAAAQPRSPVVGTAAITQRGTQVACPYCQPPVMSTPPPCHPPAQQPRHLYARIVTSCIVIHRSVSPPSSPLQPCHPYARIINPCIVNPPYCHLSGQCPPGVTIRAYGACSAYGAYRVVEAGLGRMVAARLQHLPHAVLGSEDPHVAEQRLAAEAPAGAAVHNEAAHVG